MLRRTRRINWTATLISVALGYFILAAAPVLSAPHEPAPAAQY